MKEIEYTVLITGQEDHLEISGINARVVLDDVAAGASGTVHVQQRFSLQFVNDAKFSDDDDTDGLTAGQGGKPGRMARSGHPGYIVGLPLLLGKKETVTTDPPSDPPAEAVSVYENGFVGTGADSAGRCLATAQEDLYFLASDPVVTFGEDLSYGCSLELTAAELASSCGSLALAEYEIFKNLEQIDQVGRFGNADFNYIKVSTSSYSDCPCRTGKASWRTGSPWTS